jgi:hypothetical protein
MSNMEKFRAGICGVYRGIPAAEYHSLNACSATRLKALARSPMHCMHSMTSQRETPAMKLGTAVHCAVLEPDTFAERYAPSPKVDRRTTAGKAAYQSFCERSIGKEVIDSDDCEAVARMAIEIEAHPAAKIALDRRDETELSIVWEQSGQLCKSRIDFISGSLAFDLKTAADASMDGFAWAIVRRGYDLQAAFYLMGLAAVGIHVDGFAFIAVESDEPHAVNVVAMDDADIERAAQRVELLVSEYKRCSEADDWQTGYGNSIQLIVLPRKRDIELIEA